jgi:hypothetical protein
VTDVFGRRRGKARAEESAEPAVREPEPAAPERAATTGPWDVADAPQDDIERVDLGALLVPTIAGVEIRVEADQAGAVAAVLLVHGQSGVQLEAFAAPRSEGIWHEVRDEIGTGISTEGGEVKEVEGVFGPELLARVPTPEGAQPVRFVGVDGPRWFLRAVFTGAAATDAGAEAVLTESVRQVVVVRGNDPMPVRDQLPLRLPREVVEQNTAAPTGVEPPRRGPEITEIG